MGKLERVGRRGPASRASPQPRASTSCCAPDPTTSAALVARAASAGGRFEHVRRRLDAGASNCWTNSSPWPPAIGSGDFAVPATPAASKRERGHAVKLGAPADRQAMRGGDRDPDAGEAAGADADQDPVGAAAVEQLGDHRHQPLGMAAADQLVAGDDDSAGVVEQSGRAGGARRVEGQDHGGDSGHMRPNAASPSQSVRPLRRVSTSGT